MNKERCRLHAILDGRCFLCGWEGNEHQHTYGEWVGASAFPLPDEWRKPRLGMR